jgi:hypothetical protein
MGALKRFRELFPDAAQGLPAFAEGTEHRALLRLGFQADPFADLAETEPPAPAGAGTDP